MADQNLKADWAKAFGVVIGVFVGIPFAFFSMILGVLVLAELMQDHSFAPPSSAAPVPAGWVSRHAGTDGGSSGDNTTYVAISAPRQGLSRSEAETVYRQFIVDEGWREETLTYGSGDAARVDWSYRARTGLLRAVVEVDLHDFETWPIAPSRARPLEPAEVLVTARYTDGGTSWWLRLRIVVATPLLSVVAFLTRQIWAQRDTWTLGYTGRT